MDRDRCSLGFQNPSRQQPHVRSEIKFGNSRSGVVHNRATKKTIHESWCRTETRKTQCNKKILAIRSWQLTEPSRGCLPEGLLLLSEGGGRAARTERGCLTEGRLCLLGKRKKKKTCIRKPDEQTKNTRKNGEKLLSYRISSIFCLFHNNQHFEENEKQTTTRKGNRKSTETRLKTTVCLPPGGEVGCVPHRQMKVSLVNRGGAARCCSQENAGQQTRHCKPMHT